MTLGDMNSHVMCLSNILLSHSAVHLHTEILLVTLHLASVACLCHRINFWWQRINRIHKVNSNKRLTGAITKGPPWQSSLLETGVPVWEMRSMQVLSTWGARQSCSPRMGCWFRVRERWVCGMFWLFYYVIWLGWANEVSAKKCLDFHPATDAKRRFLTTSPSVTSPRSASRSDPTG